MDLIVAGLSSFGLSFVLLLLLGNITPRFPHLPWDIYLDKIGFRVYIPFISAFALSLLFIYLSNFVRT